MFNTSCTAQFMPATTYIPRSCTYGVWCTTYMNANMYCRCKYMYKCSSTPTPILNISGWKLLPFMYMSISQYRNTYCISAAGVSYPSGPVLEGGQWIGFVSSHLHTNPLLAAKKNIITFHRVGPFVPLVDIFFNQRNVLSTFSLFFGVLYQTAFFYWKLFPVNIFSLLS
jgi:hypothetical protein